MPILSADAAVMNQMPKKRSIRASRVLSFLRALSGSSVMRWARVAGLAVTLVAILGIAGSVELGKLSLLGGAAMSALMIGIQYLCLRSIDR